MQISQMNVTALYAALATTLGMEQTQVIEKLYVSLNEAMNAGYEAGFRAAEGMNKKEEGIRVDEDGIRAPIVNAQPEGAEAVVRETSPRAGGAYDAGFDAGYNAGYDDGHFHGYREAGEEEVDAAEFLTDLNAAYRDVQMDANLQGNCAALDREMQRLHEAATDDGDYLPFPSQDRFRPTANFDTYSRG